MCVLIEQLKKAFVSPFVPASCVAQAPRPLGRAMAAFAAPWPPGLGPALEPKVAEVVGQIGTVWTELQKEEDLDL